MRCELIYDVCWIIGVWTIKYSILVFYWRLFGGWNRTIQLAIWALAIFVTCWGLVVVSELNAHT